MEVLKESKEKLPVAFVTAFVSEGWEKVGFLKEELAIFSEVLAVLNRLCDGLLKLIRKDRKK